MSRATILLVIGSRPEAIKLAPVVFALREQPGRFDAVICSTGQQRDLIPQALAEFGLEPEIELDVMREDQTLAGLTARLVTSLDSVVGQVNPDWVLVQGDTTSAMVGALASFYRGVPVGHVEAGLRTDDRRAPFPEEVNRRIISQTADLHFAPTERSAARLICEGLPRAAVQMTGNTVVDALLWMRDRIRQGASTLPLALQSRLGNKRLVLVTTHRRESFGAGIEQTCAAILALAQSMDDVVFALPVHPNPRVRDVVLQRLDRHPRIVLLEPQPYRTLVELMDRATLILTDSGGVQEEAPTFGTPVLVLRTTTERPEGIEAGVARLVGTDRDPIVEAATELLRDPDARARMSAAVGPYGDGFAARRIVEALGGERRPAAAPIEHTVSGEAGSGRALPIVTSV